MSNYTLTKYCETTEPKAAIFLLGDENMAEKVYSLVNRDDFMLISIGGIDWNADLSPWYAEKVFSGGEDFSGNAPAFLEKFLTELIPSCGKLPDKKIIAGYSLAGLFAVWSLYNTDILSGVVSCSGSMWFDSFMEYTESHEIKSKLNRAYFSLGDKEKKTKNLRMSQVERCTERISEIIHRNCENTVFRLVPGNHFLDPDKRLADGINYILEE
ncbi:MAG: alpha/beta hydrolase [Clostridia bacterium]|nr:alpha/beta hydrolase [Clostridia bacterium]